MSIELLPAILMGAGGGSNNFQMQVGTQSIGGGVVIRGFRQEPGVLPHFGSISPGVYRGARLAYLYSFNTTGWYFAIEGSLPANFLTRLHVVGHGEAYTAGATHNHAGGLTLWLWSATPAFPVSGTYDIIIT